MQTFINNVFDKELIKQDLSHASSEILHNDLAFGFKELYRY